MHACVTYSHVGDWYITEKPEPSLAAKIPFVFWQGHLQSFFMGLLFFLSGVFAEFSMKRRGPARFAQERLHRLGLPALFYMSLIHPFILFVLLRLPQTANRPPLASLYFKYLLSPRMLSGSGPLWFALALLVFCLVYAGWRTVFPEKQPDHPATAHAPGFPALATFGSLLVVATFLVRLVEPIGTNFLNMQLCFFPQYIAAFVAGICAGKSGWLETLSTSRRARIAGWLGLIGGPLLLATVIILGGPPPDNGPNPYAGGLNGQAFGLALWEQTAGLCLGLGMLALFRARFQRATAAGTWLSDRSFAVYVLHPPVLIALTMLLRPLNIGLYAHVASLTVLAIVGSFLAAEMARRAPGLRSIL
jgi:fucose 4-O-acetylase-like acetyltransferase